MAAAKHSPGPWWATDYGIRNAGGYICALVHPTKYEGQDERYAAEKAEREGDARLLAAAAAMYEALEQIDNWLVCGAIATPEDMAQSFQHMQQVACNALALAWGEA